MTKAADRVGVTWLWASVLFAHNRAYTAAMSRQRVWVQKQNFQGFGCSECNWAFKPSGAPVGESLDEMKQKYEAECLKEFAVHVCDKYRRDVGPKTEQGGKS